MRIAAFDLDKTLFWANSSFQFAHYLYRQNHFSLSKLFFSYNLAFLHLLGCLSIQQVHEKAFDRLFKGLSLLEVDAWVSQFLDQSFDQLLYLPAMKELQKAQVRGDLTVILSSSPDFLVRPIAERLQCSTYFATKYAVDEKYNLHCISHLIHGEEKARLLTQLCFQSGCSKENIIAYSDSHHDLPFLLAAGTAVGVNPSYKLRALCRMYQWPILE